MDMKSHFDQFRSAQEAEESRIILPTLLGNLIREAPEQYILESNRLNDIGAYKKGIKQLGEEGEVEMFKETRFFEDAKKQLIENQIETTKWRNLRYLQNNTERVPDHLITKLVKALQANDLKTVYHIVDEMKRPKREQQPGQSDHDTNVQMEDADFVPTTHDKEDDTWEHDPNVDEEEDGEEYEKKERLPYKTENFSVDKTLIGKTISEATLQIPHKLNDICKQHEEISSGFESYGTHSGRVILKIDGIPGVIVGHVQGEDEYRSGFSGWIHITNIEPVSVSPLGKVTNVTDRERIGTGKDYTENRSFQRIITEKGEIEYGTSVYDPYYPSGYVRVETKK